MARIYHPESMYQCNDMPDDTETYHTCCCKCADRDKCAGDRPAVCKQAEVYKVEMSCQCSGAKNRWLSLIRATSKEDAVAQALYLARPCDTCREVYAECMGYKRGR